MTGIAELHAIARMVLEQEEAISAKLQDEADEQRGLIEQFDRQASQAYQPSANAFDRRRSGADHLWLRRLSMLRAQSNSALATIRARQVMQQEALAEAFGREAALAEIRKEAEKKAKRQRTKREEEAIQSLALLRMVVPEAPST